MRADEEDEVSQRIHECRGDFWLRLEEAMQQCGGNPLFVLQRNFLGADSIAEMTVWKAAQLLAQNGIRMTFSPRWHMSPELFMPEGSLTTTERTSSNKN